MGNPVDTQNRLIAATRRIIIEEGIEKTTVEHICRVAGFSRGAFYANFSSKDELLMTLAEEEYDTLIDRLQTTTKGWAIQTRTRREQGLPEPENVIEELLAETLDVIGMDRAMFLLHSEVLMRSIRNPAWSLALRDINEQFADELGKVLVEILTAAGRKPTRSVFSMTQAVIGVVMRVACVAGLQEATLKALEKSGHPTPTIEPHTPHSYLSPSAQQTATFILDILNCSSAPISTT